MTQYDGCTHQHFFPYTNVTGNNFVPLSSELHMHVQSATEKGSKVCCVENVFWSSCVLH